MTSAGAGLPVYAPPADVAMAQEFWDAIARGQLMLPRCSVCRAWQWYPDADGTDCTGGELVWQDVPLTGTVYSYTRVQRSFLPGGRDQAPYTVGLIDLDGVEGPRLVVPLLDDAAIGDRVQARFVAHGERTMLAFATAP
jgi:uncharacterized OB-fold protein